LPSHDRDGVFPDACITAAIFIANLLLLGPWLTTDFSEQPWNNGYIYIATARMFRDLPWTWNPLQYGGAPFHYLYPPIFPTLVGLLRFLSLGHAFHLVTGIGYALAPVCLYVLAMALFRSRALAVFAAIAYSIFPSPAYLMPSWRTISQPYAHAPLGFVTLVAFDEAAHTFALPLVLLAAAMAWHRRWTPAAVLAGAVFLTSWPALIGLGFAMAGIAVAGWRDWGVPRAAASVAGLIGTAYGLSAFWMTPGNFVSSTLLNRIVLRHTLSAAPWNGKTWIILAAAVAMVALSLWRHIPKAVAMAGTWVALSGLVVVSYAVVGNYLAPSPHRYILELNASSILLVTGLISIFPRRFHKGAIIILILAAAPFSYRFVTHSWKFQPRSQDPRAGVAYQVAMWLKDHVQTGRVLASGELDSTLNLWTDVAQVGGPGQDPSNFLIFAAERQIAFGCDADSERIAELWLRALNAPWLVVHGAASREYFHWYARPNRFAALPVAWDNGAGDRVYHLPIEPRDAVVVDLHALPHLTSTEDAAFLNAYVNWAAGKRPVPVHWISAGEAAFDVNLAADEAVLLKVNNAPGWRASGATLENDPIGFQLIRLPPGPRHVTLQFGASWDTWLGRAITLVTIILLLARVKPVWIAAGALLPAVAAWAVLISDNPQTQVAEDAFVRLQPPMINSRGIVDATNQQPPLERGRPFSIYGLNFGSPGESVRVWIGDHAAPFDSRGPNQINLHWPADAPASAPVSVEVNGCVGNAFSVTTR
jgi:hypothetical protein